MPKSAYIHIPFCRQKCYYCSFASYPTLELKNDYIKSLLTEITSRYQGEKLKTLYIGGGTPSLLEIEDIKKIISVFNLDNDSEITCEANPEKLSLDWLKAIYDVGINRLSLGVQSFDEKLLNLIGRKHSVKDAFNTIDNAKKAGFQNINIDLIYGLPTQTMSDVSASVITACELGIQHLSSYGLKIEEKSVFYNKKLENLPDEDLQADMYLKLIEITDKYGFEHYEISNFSQKNFESKHNLNYWNAENYYGFGCAASGYEDDIRYSHENTIKQYIDNPLKLTEIENLSYQNQLEEAIFLGLRKSQGINIKKLNEKFNIDFDKKYYKILNKYSKYIEKAGDYYSFNDNGFLISNCILAEFIDE